MPVVWWGAGTVSGYGSPEAHQSLSPSPPPAQILRLPLTVIFASSPNTSSSAPATSPRAGQAPSTCSLPVAHPCGSPPYPLPRPQLLQPRSRSPPLHPFYLEDPPPAAAPQGPARLPARTRSSLSPGPKIWPCFPPNAFTSCLPRPEVAASGRSGKNPSVVRVTRTLHTQSR